MAAALPTGLETECPVCHEGFKEPKLLPCTHLVCRKCVLSWLQKGGDQSGCPLCREPIVPPSHRDESDLVLQVDALPTDFATAVVVESEKTLNDSRVCNCCETEEGSLFCLQCAVKLCITCSKYHAKIPATRDHVTQKLSDLSVEQLASHQPITCTNHSGKQVELYCTHHEELLCLLCASSTHRQCPDVRGITDVATEKREELAAQVQKLEDRETIIMAKIRQLDLQMADSQVNYKAMRAEVKATFDDLQKSLDAQRQKLNLDIQQREDAFLADRKSSKLDLEKSKATLSAHKSTAKRVVSSAPDNSLLGMMGKLKSRLATLESQVLPDDPKTMTGILTLNSDMVEKAKKTITVIGKLTDSSSPQKELLDPQKGQVKDDIATGESHATGGTPHSAWMEVKQMLNESNTQYISVQVLLEGDFRGHQRSDLYDNNKVSPRTLKVKKQATLLDLLKLLSENLKHTVRQLRPWPFHRRQNDTFRPTMIDLEKDMNMTVLDLADGQNPWTVFVEICRPVLPHFDKDNDVLLFLKLYDPRYKSLTYCGHLLVPISTKGSELVSELNKKAGSAINTQLILFEEVKSNMINQLEDLTLPLEKLIDELMDGDIIVFQEKVDSHANYDLPTAKDYFRSIQTLPPPRTT